METLLVALVFVAFLLAQIAAVIAVYGDRTGRRPEALDAHRNPDKPPVSRPNWPTQEQLLAARRERGLVLRALMAGLARNVLRMFSERSRSASPTWRSTRPTR